MSIEGTISLHFGTRNRFRKKHSFTTDDISDIMPTFTTMPIGFSRIPPDDDQSIDSSTAPVVHRRLERRRRTSQFKQRKQAREELYELLKQAELAEGSHEDETRRNLLIRSKSLLRESRDVRKSARSEEVENSVVRTEQTQVHPNKEERTVKTLPARNAFDPLSRSWHGNTDMSSFSRKAMEELSREWKGKIVSHVASTSSPNEKKKDTATIVKASLAPAAKDSASSHLRCTCPGAPHLGCSLATSDQPCCSFRDQKWYSKNDFAGMVDSKSEDVRSFMIQNSSRSLNDRSTTSSTTGPESSSSSASSFTWQDISVTSREVSASSIDEGKTLSAGSMYEGQEEVDSSEDSSVSSRDDESEEDDEEEDSDHYTESSLDKFKDCRKKPAYDAEQDDVSEISLDLEDFDDNSDETARARDPNSSGSNFLVGELACSPAFGKSTWHASANSRSGCSRGNGASSLFDSIMEASRMDDDGRMLYDRERTKTRTSHFFEQGRTVGIWIVENAFPFMTYLCVFFWYCKIFLMDNGGNGEVEGNDETLGDGLRRFFLDQRA